MKTRKPHFARSVPLLDRFWSQVDKLGPDECWLWIGSRNARGYGQLGYQAEKFFVHVLSYELHHGSIPLDLLPSGRKKMRVCHTCDRPACVNPNHLWLGTQSQNMIDARDKGRLSWLIQRNMERGKAMKPIREQRKKERLERIALGIERPRDSYGRIAGSIELPPPQRDEKGHFLPNPLTAVLEQLTPLRRMVRNAWFSQGEDFAAVEFAMGSGRSLKKIIKVMDWLSRTGLAPTL